MTEIPRFLFCVAAGQRAAQLVRFRVEKAVTQAIREVKTGLIAIPLWGPLAEAFPEPPEPDASEHLAVSDILFSATSEIDVRDDSTAIVGHTYALRIGFAVDQLPNNEAAVAALGWDIPIVAAAHSTSGIDWVNGGQAKIICSLVHEPSRIRWVSLPFRASTAGQKSIALDCFSRRQWIATFHFEFEAVGAAMSVEGVQNGYSGAAQAISTRSGWHPATD